VDLHCHFRKKNIFIYGCDGGTGGSIGGTGGGTERGEEEKEENSVPPAGLASNNVRSFPYLLSQKAPCFSFSDCSFKVYYKYLNY
jgi:hypothetical protein